MANSGYAPPAAVDGSYTRNCMGCKQLTLWTSGAPLVESLVVSGAENSVWDLMSVLFAWMAFDPCSTIPQPISGTCGTIYLCNVYAQANRSCSLKQIRDSLQT